MYKQRKYVVRVTPDSVDAAWESAHRSILVRIFGSVAIVALAAAWMYFVIFVPHAGYSARYAFTHERPSSHFFIEAAISTLLSLIVYVFLIGGYGLRSLYPSGEQLRCDHSQLVISKIPWNNFRGQWKTRTFLIAAVSQVNYGILSRSTSAAPNIYGIRFLANGKVQKALSRIEAPEASHVLRGLKRLGVDVSHDPDMLARIQATLGDRREEL